MISSKTINTDSKFLPYLLGICEALLYSWFSGVALPHSNALYNIGLFGANIFGYAYIILNRGAGLKELPPALSFGFFLFFAWSFLSCYWAPLPNLAINEWLGNPGIAFLTTWICAVVFQKESSQKRLWIFFILLSTFLASMFIAEWISASISTKTFIPPYPTMRSWGDRLILCFPFLIFANEQPYKKHYKLLIKCLTFIFAILMLVTGARGVWLTLAFYLTSWAFLVHRGKQLLTVASTLCLIVGLSFMIPNNPLVTRFSNITYVTDRVNYTWGPAIRFWQDSPVYGIGYSTNAFFNQAEALSKNDKNWLKNFDEATKATLTHLGPHSNYLEVLAGGGIIGLLLLLYFYGQVIKQTLFSTGPANFLLNAAGLGIFVKYMVHGTVESINWKALGILTGLMLATLMSKKVILNQAHDTQENQK